MRKLLLLFSHLTVLGIGFALGVYLLPILVAERAPSAAQYQEVAAAASFRGQFRPDLKGSDLLHWGDGEVIVSPKAIAHRGRLSPGPDYKAYLVPDFVDDEESFMKLKDQSLRVGDVKSFSGFLLPLPEGTDLTRYTTVVIWCEAFSEFISAAKYR